MNDLALAITGTDLPAHLKGDDNRGNDNVGNQLIIPRMKLLQKMSNEVDKNHPEYIEEAEVGMFANTLTKKCYDELYVISLNFKVQYAVWRDIDLGGGYGGSFDTLAEAEAHIEAQDKPSEWAANENHSHLVVVIDPETGELEPSPVIFDFTSSKLAASRAWNSKLSIQGGPRFASTWKITSKTVTSKMGKQYENLDVELLGWSKKDNFEAAEALYESFKNV